jgi:maltose alpha-D-glucosyltransferase / alpha-amylase
LRVRREYKAFGRGTFCWVNEPNERIAAFLRSYQDEHVLVVVNLASTPQMATLDLSAFAGTTPVELFGNAPFPKINDEPYHLTMAARGYFWLKLPDPRTGK